MSQSDAWTVGRLLQWTTDYLKSRGADSPRLDAEVLLAHALGCPRIGLYTSFDEVPGDAARTAFRELVRQRAEGMPVAYLVGRREFFSLNFHVTPDVLIPRPETELLVVRLLDLAARRGAASRPPRIVDVGTGSGIIAVCAARHLPDSRVTAVDHSAAALAIARRNAAEHGVADRVEFVEGDLLEDLPAEQQFDFVVSNPPYVRTSEMAQLDPSVREHEPRQALEAGPRGTEVIERLVPQAAERLVSGGWLLLEVSPVIHADVESLVKADPRWELGPTIKDAAGHARVVQARRK